MYGLNPDRDTDVVEVFAVLVGFPDAEQLTKYPVTSAEGGSDGRGGIHDSTMDVALTFLLLSLATCPGGTIMNSPLYQCCVYIHRYMLSLLRLLLFLQFLPCA